MKRMNVIEGTKITDLDAERSLDYPGFEPGSEHWRNKLRIRKE